MNAQAKRTAGFLAKIIAGTEEQQPNRFADSGGCEGARYIKYEKSYTDAVGELSVEVSEDVFLQHQRNLTSALKDELTPVERAAIEARLVRHEENGHPVLSFADASVAFSGYAEAPTTREKLSAFVRDLAYAERTDAMAELELKICTKVWQGEGVEQEVNAMANAFYDPTHPLNLTADAHTARKLAEAYERTAANMKEDLLGHPHEKPEYDAHMREELAHMELRVSDAVFLEYQAKALQDAINAGNAEGFYRDQARQLTVQGKAMLDYQEACNAADRLLDNDSQALDDEQGGIPPRAVRLLNAENDLLSAIWDKDDPSAEKGKLAKLLFDPNQPINVAVDATAARMFVDALSTLASRTRDELLGINRGQGR